MEYIHIIHIVNNLIQTLNSFQPLLSINIVIILLLLEKEKWVYDMSHLSVRFMMCILVLTTTEIQEHLHNYGQTNVLSNFSAALLTNICILLQELEHQKGVLASDLNEAKNSWINKAFTSLRTSSRSLSIPKDGAPAVGWNLHSGSLSRWKTKKLSWPHRDNREDVWHFGLWMYRSYLTTVRTKDTNLDTRERSDFFI